MTKPISKFKFTVFNRPQYGWYYQYWDGSGKRSSQLSIAVLVKTMCIEDEYPAVRNRKQGERIVLMAYERGFIKESMGSSELLLKYLKDYWDFKGDRIRRANRRRANSISENYASIMHGYVEKHIAPVIPKGMKVGEVTAKFVRDFSDRLLDKGGVANGTIDKIMVALTKALRTAHKEGLVYSDPTRLVEAVDPTPKRQRGILTNSEFQQVVALMREKASEHTYLAALLAAATGMRLGELRNLYAADFNIVNEQDTIIDISKSWSVKGGEKSTKGKKARFSPCPTWLARKLLDLAGKNPRGSSLVFWSLTKTKTPAPVSESFIREEFYTYLYGILEKQAGVKAGTMVTDDEAVARGVTDKDGNPPKVRSGEIIRRERNIVFHSFRHFFNTEAQVLGADGDKLRLSVGHESKAMTDNYTHQSYDLMKSIADISHQIVGEAEVVEEKEIE